MSQDAHKDLFSSESALSWKETLKGQMPDKLAAEIDEFESLVALKKQGKIDDKVFAESRLRRGAYGQRYDNGHRSDGKEDKTINFPNLGTLTKGPGTQWEAPGMLRIKIPYGGLNAKQLDVMADLAEEYSDNILHVTTRQDIQLHYIHIEDTPAIFRRLASVGITTREACGNSVRNVTACPLSGICTTETFDTTPYAKALTYFLLGHPDTQDFGRKFKFAFSGCEQNPCGLVTIHDMGFIAATKTENGQIKRGFKTYIGGGLGALPYQAVVYEDFVPEEELLPLAQAVSRVFAKFGEKQKRNRARIKFLVSDWGIEKFKQTVIEERKTLEPDPRWTEFLKSLNETDETPLKGPGKNPGAVTDPEYVLWQRNNVHSQRQAGYSYVQISLPLGDLSSNQTRALADIARKYVGDTIRTTVEQNIILRWVSDSDIPALYQDLKAVKLAQPHAETIVDVVACPGTDTCKLGVSSSRGLAGELHKRLAVKSHELDEAVKGLRIKISGCFNSCGQHHISDLGFYGVSRKVGNYMIPHFQLVIGGQWDHNAAHYGQAIVAIPSKAVPDVIDTLCELYVKNRQGAETFRDFIERTGKVGVKLAIEKFTEIPAYEANPDFYMDWSSTREYSKKDIGIGECAGEVVSLADFGLAAADRLLFEAQIQLDKGDAVQAAATGWNAMLEAALGLVKTKNRFASSKPDDVVKGFKEHLYDTKLFFDPFAGDKFANFFLKAASQDRSAITKEKSRLFLEESQLFIEAAYSCNVRLTMGAVGANANPAV